MLLYTYRYMPRVLTQYSSSFGPSSVSACFGWFSQYAVTVSAGSISRVDSATETRRFLWGTDWIRLWFRRKYNFQGKHKTPVHSPGVFCYVGYNVPTVVTNDGLERPKKELAVPNLRCHPSSDRRHSLEPSSKHLSDMHASLRLLWHDENALHITSEFLTQP